MLPLHLTICVKRIFTPGGAPAGWHPAVSVAQKHSPLEYQEKAKAAAQGLLTEKLPRTA